MTTLTPEQQEYIDRLIENHNGHLGKVTNKWDELCLWEKIINWGHKDYLKKQVIVDINIYLPIPLNWIDIKLVV